MTDPGPAWAVLVAAGSGSRLGADLPKALVPVAGTPLVVHAVNRLVEAGLAGVVVAVPEGFEDQVRTMLDGRPVAVVVGGATRQASVARALGEVPTAAAVVLVHDAARAFAPPALIARVLAAVQTGHVAVIPVVAVADTLVRTAGGATDGAAGGAAVLGYADRSELRAVQTPQGFARAVLVRAHAAAADRARDESTAATDDASLVAALGEPVWAVPGDTAAAKVTSPRDLVFAESLAGAP